MIHFCYDSVVVQYEVFESNSFFKATICFTKKSDDELDFF